MDPSDDDISFPIAVFLMPLNDDLQKEKQLSLHPTTSIYIIPSLVSWRFKYQTLDFLSLRTSADISIILAQIL